MEEPIENYRSIRLMRFFMRAIGMWPEETYRARMASNLLVSYTVFTMIAGCFVEGSDFYYSLDDLQALAYCAPCISAAAAELAKLLVFVHIRNEVREFIIFTERVYWRSKYDAEEIELIKNCDTMCLISSLIFMFLTQVITAHYLIVPYIESIGKHGIDRVLPFKMWYTFIQFTATPYYEITYTIQSCATISVCVCVSAFAIFLFTINLHSACQFQVLQHRIQKTCETYEKSYAPVKDAKDVTMSVPFEMLKDCIRQHQTLISYVSRVEGIFCYILLGQVFTSVMQICFCGLQILIGVGLSISRTILSSEYFIASFIQLFFFAYSAHQISLESEAISHAAYHAKWYKLPAIGDGKAFTQSLMILVAKARRPCILTVGKFTPLTLDTFTSVVKTSMSYFTVLRQANES